MSKNFLKRMFARKAEKQPLTTYQVHGITIRVDNEESKQKLTEIIEKLQQIETGRGVLKVLEDSKTPLLMESMGNTIGYFSSPNLKIALNYEIPTEKLCSTLVHESHHLMQYLNGGKEYDRFNLDLKSQIMNDRAKEADAQTWAIRACHEWRELGDDKPYQQFKKYYPPIEAAFDKALKENGGIMDNRVLTETFKGWYAQDGVRTVYENNYMLSPATNDIAGTTASTVSEREEKMAKEEDGVIFYYQNLPELKSMTPQQIIGMYSSDYFIDDPAILESPECLAVRPYTKGMMQYVLDKTGREDKTCFTLPETRQGAGKDYQFNGYLANLAKDDMVAQFRGAVRAAAKEAGVPYKDVKKALTSGIEAQKAFMEAHKGNTALESSFARIALLQYEQESFARFNKAMDYAPVKRPDGRKTPMPNPLQNPQDKDFDRIAADYYNDQMVCQAGAFILDYAVTKPSIAKALWESKVVPDVVKKTLETQVFGYFPQPTETQPVTKEDLAALRKVKKAIASRAQLAAAAEAKSAQKNGTKAVETPAPAKNKGMTLAAAAISARRSR